MNWELLGLIGAWSVFAGSVGSIGVIEYIWRTDPSADVFYHKPTSKFILPMIVSGIVLGVYYLG